MSVKVRILIVLLGAVATILILLALQLLAPGDKLDQTGPDGAHIIFSVDQKMVFAPGACVTMRWQVDHIQKVNFDDQPTVGQGIEQICVKDQTLPVLHVVFQDGTEQDYLLGVKFLVEQPLAWLLAWTGLLLLLISIYTALSRSAVPIAMPAGLRHTPRGILFFAAIGLLFSGVVIIAVPLELGLRLFFGRWGTDAEQTAYLRSRDEIQMQSDTMLLPSLEYGLTPGFPGHNRLGNRGDDIQVPKPAGVYRIAVLGDSTTYGISVPYNETYSADLQQVLRDDYGYKNVEVVNRGVPAYRSWNILMDLAFRVTELQPDLVIVYTGWNDIGPREQSPDCYSGPSPFLGVSPIYQAGGKPADLSSLALYRFLAIPFGWMPIPSPTNDTLIPKGVQCSPQVISEIPQNLQTNRPVYYERNLQEMIGIAKVLGIKIMFMTWAYNTNSPNFPDVRRAGIAEHNLVTAHIAQQNGVLFFDNAAVASRDKSSWADAVHLSVRGSLEQAQKIAKFLVDQQVITQGGS